jgi:hypothetical protein
MTNITMATILSAPKADFNDDNNINSHCFTNTPATQMAHLGNFIQNQRTMTLRILGPNIAYVDTSSVLAHTLSFASDTIVYPHLIHVFTSI